MHIKNFVPGLFLGTAAAQSLTEALASQNASLSVLNNILADQPDLVRTLGSATNVTLLAPSNDAFNRFLNTSSGSAAANDSGALVALLTYHVLTGTYYASNLTSLNGPAFIPTLLSNTSYANVTGGQRVEATTQNSGLSFISGSGQLSNVTTANVNFTGGTIHIIDNVLSIPQSDAATLTSANLTSLAEALTQANLVQTVSDLADVTIFAPSNEAFNAIGNLIGGLSADELTAILTYHVVPGRVLYSSLIGNTTVQAASKNNISITMQDGSVFVNSAKVIKADVFAANGVVHVIDNVLNPQNSTAVPNPTATTQAPAFSGATSATSSQGAGTETSSGFAVPMRTGAVGAAALFGGAALLVNL